MVLSVGVLGVGHFGRFHALKLASAVPRARLAGVFDADPARAAAIAAEAGAPALDSAAALIAASDAVVVAAPTRFHAELAGAALSAGRHVLVEKPMTASLAEADALIALARRRGAVLQVGHLERFSAALQLLCGAGPGGGVLREWIGRPLYLEAIRIAPFRPRSLDVSVVLDLMIHDLDLALALVGSELESVDAVGAPVMSPHTDIANARLRFADGAAATITASRVSLKMERKLRVFGTRGYLNADFLARSLHLVRRGAGEPLPAMPEFGIETRSWQDHDSLEAELRAFVASCLDGAPVVVDGAAGRRALEAGLRVLDSIAANRAKAEASGLLGPD
ncbi:UDP-N-acetylglucosamine 3-dehydrogenase [Caldovatus sediminis]|uniref:UDP-N-acetylglucosamine 3-dehydrogenase n=1 Tax=Caldovatus sediminis TaxID=2041189 RepID=A0A8J3EEB0_9PROT|nr:Gfo/Idh/MocA family oxidoreductase [Caldovatus sediminis]GGG38731.1 UDP-N-acetylglucosamine 3-dehydrogenase [Caldovatus sediminis]